MSTKTNYFKLGMFIIIAVIILLVSIFFLGAREMFRKEWLLETYIDASVQGLDIGSPVKMMGVKIGVVKDISFVYEHYQTEHSYIYIVFSIDPLALGAKRPHMTMEELNAAVQKEVQKGLRLTLASQGITGIAFLDASFYEPEKVTNLEIDWKPKHPYLPAVPGTLARLKSSLETTLDSISKVDFAGISEKVDKSLASITGLIDDELKPMIKDLRGEVTSALANIRKATDGAPEVTARLNLTLQSLYDLVNDQKGGLAEIGENMRIISENLRQLTEKAQRDPSQVIFGEPPPPSEVIE